MNNDLKDRVQVVQSSMLESECVKSCFEEPVKDDLRILIRLTLEFDEYLKNGIPGLRVIAESERHRPGGYIIPSNEIEMEELKYSLESIFSGIDSYRKVNAEYSILVGSTNSKIEWGMVSMISLKELFVSTFHKFTAETAFVKKCRLLLDLFKIQIVFAGALYD